MRDAYDVVIVGAGLAGCTAAILFGRQGLRVAVVEAHRNAATFKRACTHYIQPSALPTLRRLGLDELSKPSVAFITASIGGHPTDGSSMRTARVYIRHSATTSGVQCS